MTQETIVDAGPLTALQLDCERALKAVPYFGDIPVITERAKNLTNQIQLALGVIQGEGGKNGICCVVLTPRLKVSKPNIPGPYFDQVVLTVLTVEDPLLNNESTGTRKPAADVALAVAAILHHHTSPEGLYGVINCTGVGLTSDQRFADYLLYSTDFETKIGMKMERITPRIGA